MFARPALDATLNPPLAVLVPIAAANSRDDAKPILRPAVVPAAAAAPFGNEDAIAPMPPRC